MSEQEIRRLLFTPCQTKEHFSNWIEFFLGLRLPDCTVSDESNSNPLDFAWECYDRMRRNDLEQFNRMMSYASRGGLKTLSASILEVIGLFHLGRNMAHMAAIVRQAKKGQEYVKGFFNKRYLRDFVHSDNASQVTVLGFHHAEKDEYLNEMEWKALPVEIGNEYRRIENYVRIVVANMAGANCIHPDTLITKWDGSVVPAWELNPGDSIKTFDAVEDRWVENKLHHVGYTRKFCVKLTFEGGGNVIVSEDHPVFSNNGYRRARTLKYHHKFWLMGYESPKPSFVDSTEREEKFTDPWQAIKGTLLGDSSLVWPKQKGKKYGKGPRLFCYHSAPQKDLIFKIKDLLSAVGIDSHIVPDKKGFKINSSVSEKLIPLWNDLQLGDGKKKTPTPEFIESLDEQAIAFWYMDDGRGGPMKIGSAKNTKSSFATCGFDRATNELLCNKLHSIGLHTAKVSMVTNQRKKKYDIIEMSIEDSRKMTEKIGEFILPCCRYKLLEPMPFLDSYCIETGEKLAPNDRSTSQGFRRIPGFDKKRPTIEAHRKKWLDFSKRFNKKLLSIESLPEQTVVDIVLDENTHPRQRNFIANSMILLHNSDHVEFMVTDEVDVIPKQNIAAYHQAKSIPDSRDGLIPLTVLTSTRKSRVGLVQKEIEEAATTGLEIRHWNIIDVTQKCPPERHKPEGPKQTFYINDELIRHITEDDYKILDQTQQKKYYPQEGFAGCGGCRLFSVCKGRLATEQKSDSPLLKPITEIISKFKGAPDADYITTEYMCRKPDASGLIYPKLKREIHSKTVDQIAEIAFGPGHGIKDKAALIQKFKENGASFYGGMDFGFSHDFSFVIMVVWGHRAFILDCMSRSGLELDEKIASSTAYKDLYSPTIFGDPAYPADILTFRRRGFKMKEWQKYPGSVKAGIEIMRMMMLSGNGDTRLYFLADDPGVEFLFDQLEKYSFQTDAAGEPTEDPVKENDDAADAIRYMVMNVIAPGGKLKIDAPASVVDLTPVVPNVGRNDYATQMSDIISKHTGGTTASTDSDLKIPVKPNGRFFFDP